MENRAGMSWTKPPVLLHYNDIIILVFSLSPHYYLPTWAQKLQSQKQAKKSQTY